VGIDAVLEYRYIGTNDKGRYEYTGVIGEGKYKYVSANGTNAMGMWTQT
jgi:hypothetical protein